MSAFPTRIATTALALGVFFAVSPASAQWRLNEIVADNDGSLLDGDGAASDWLEIHNASAAAATLAGLFLTDDPAVPDKWPLPATEVPAGGYLVVFASGKDRATPGAELHANFSLSARGEYLALVAADRTTVLSAFAPAFPRQFRGTAYGIGPVNAPVETVLLPWPTDARWIGAADLGGPDWRAAGFDDAAWNAAQTGIGYGYALPGYIGEGGDTQAAMQGMTPGAFLRVPFTVPDPSEVLSLNLDLFYEDGFAAYLNGQLVASENVPDPLLPDSLATASREVRAGDSMDVFPIGFAGKLLPGNNVLAIHLLNNITVGSDVLLVPRLRATVEISDGPLAIGYLTAPTPGAPNALLAYTDYVRDTRFDVDRGFYDTPFDVTITCATPGATIAYTTDGSTPSPTNGILVAPPDPNTPPTAIVPVSTTTPLRATAFKNGLRPADVDTQTYFFLDDVLNQPVHPAGYPLPWIQRNGATIGGDYEMDANIVGPVYSRAELKTALRDLPTFSIVTDIANLFDQQTGIQVNPQDAGAASERRVSMEVLDFGDAPPMQLDAGMRMNGNASRSPTRPKHNFRLIFRNDYGAGRLEFPLFGQDAPAVRFNQIVLRGGNGNAWIHTDPFVYNNAMYIRDQWFRDAHSAMGYPEALQREAHVYFNGLYWGMHHLFERIEEEWTAERFGGAPEDWEGFRIVGGNAIEVVNGTPAEESARMLVSWQATLDAALAGNLDAAEQYLDLDAFIDYLLLNFHAGNNDWDQNNVRAMRRKSPPGKWMFFCHDAERAGLNALNNIGATINVTTKNTARGPTSINTALRSNPEYALRFADRTYRHLFNGGALTPENGQALWAARADGIRSAMKAESARWGDFKGEPPRTLVQWEAALQREYTQWFPVRTPITISQLRAFGLYPAIDPPVFNQHGGMVAPGFSLVLSNTGGEIYYTTDGSDPRLPGGAIHPSATRLDGSLVETELVPAASTWRYLDDGVDLGTAWRGTGFNDSAWLSGPGPLGYGQITGYAQLGTNINPAHYLTNYFRKTVDVQDAALLTAASLEVMSDGGAVVYLNGTEIARDNMPAGVIAFDTPSPSDGNEGDFDPFPFDPALFVEGVNVLAVELHNSSTTSSDMAMDVRISVIGLNPGTPPVPIGGPTTLRARSLDGGTWSALAEATFVTGIPARAANLVISEIYYNPAGAGEETEFIELMNISADTLSLADVAFTGGIAFTFPFDAILAPGARLLLVADPVAFAATYGAGLPVAGTYTGRLDNSGETLTLLAANGSIIASFRYDDRAPWPLSPDGGGTSLTLVAPASAPDPADPRSWRASVHPGGSPGASDAVPFPGGDASALLAYALDGNLDTAYRPLEINGVPGTYLVVLLPVPPAADDARVTVQFSADLQTWRGAGAYLGTENGVVAFRAPDPGVATPHFARAMVELRP